MNKARFTYFQNHFATSENTTSEERSKKSFHEKVKIHKEFETSKQIKIHEEFEISKEIKKYEEFDFIQIEELIDSFEGFYIPNIENIPYSYANNENELLKDIIENHHLVLIASERLLKDKNFMLAAINANLKVMEYLTDEVITNADIMAEIMQKIPTAIAYIEEAMQASDLT